LADIGHLVNRNALFRRMGSAVNQAIQLVQIY
jgi:hypothetical protein